MAQAIVVAEAYATEPSERTEREAVRPWHELEYALLIADSDRLLADALTPQAVGLLRRMAIDRSGRSHPPAFAPSTWAVHATPDRPIGAKQRAPPRHCRTERINLSDNLIRKGSMTVE